jgi:ankyrin repeat protein
VLLSAGASVSCLQNKSTPLHIACQRGDAEVVSVLLSAGAMIDAPGEVSAV